MINSNGYGMLYICPTPIGNMGDITLRTIEVLRSVDIIACEDTRQTAKLTSRYHIHTTLTSYHDHNRRSKGEKLLEMLLSGNDVALVSDAGMPGISDPGEDLIRLCIDNSIEYTVLPGPSAAITALIMSGLSCGGFVFDGFLPRKSSDRREALERLSTESRTSIIYESPHHLLTTLKDLEKYLPERRMTIVREISKKFEEKIYTSTGESVNLFENRQIKGEYVLVIEGLSVQQAAKLRSGEYEDLPIDRHMAMYMEKGMDQKQAMKAVAGDLGITKREVYARYIATRGEGYLKREDDHEQ